MVAQYAVAQGCYPGMVWYAGAGSALAQRDHPKRYGLRTWHHGIAAMSLCHPSMPIA